MSSALTPFNPQDIVTMAVDMRAAVLNIRERVLVKDSDYGSITDGGKPTLLKPGAEKLASAFKLSPKFTIVSQVEDWSTGLFFYRYECVLVHRETGEIHGSGIGSCNSHEEKYGYRWVSADRVPANLEKDTLPVRSGSITEFEFAIQKAETSGKYGKPAEYWTAFAQAIANGTAIKGERKTAKGMSVTWSIGGNEYRIPNINVFDVVNTIDKMAQKRALVAAVLVATNASEFFTQDLEDFDSDTGNVLTGKTAPMIKAPTPIEPVKSEAPQWWSVLKEYKPFMLKSDFENMTADLSENVKSGSLYCDSMAIARAHIEMVYGVDIDMDALTAARKEAL